MGTRHEVGLLVDWLVRGYLYIAEDEDGDNTHMVFQLNFPSYDNVRLKGSLVKSTRDKTSSSPGKYSSKDGASGEMAAKRRPLDVTF